MDKKLRILFVISLKVCSFFVVFIYCEFLLIFFLIFLEQKEVEDNDDDDMFASDSE